MNDKPIMDEPPTVKEAVVELVVQVMELHVMMEQLFSLVSQGRAERLAPQDSNQETASLAFEASSARLRERFDRTFEELKRLADRMISPDA